MCSGPAPWRAACHAVAAPRERRRPAGWRPDGCSCRRPARSTRAGAAGAAAGPPTPCRATAPQTDHPGLVPTRAKRCAATPPEPRPARARAPMPMPGHPPPAEVAEQGLRPMTARRSRHRLPHRRREQQRERRTAPETATRFRSTPTAAVARRHARCRGPVHQSGSLPAPRACSLSPHYRCTRQPAVHQPAPIGARAPSHHRSTRRPAVHPPAPIGARAPSHHRSTRRLAV